MTQCRTTGHTPSKGGERVCIYCGALCPFTYAYDSTMSLLDLEAILVGRHRAQAIVVQYAAATWKASIRTARGVGPTCTGPTPTDAIIALLNTLEGT